MINMMIMIHCVISMIQAADHEVDEKERKKGKLEKLHV